MAWPRRVDCVPRDLAVISSGSLSPRSWLSSSASVGGRHLGRWDQAETDSEADDEDRPWLVVTGTSFYYTACCLDELSRGSVLCLFNASFEKRFPKRHNSIFYADIDDHGVRQDDTGQILARSRCTGASRVALDLPYWAMHLASYRLIRMAIEMASKVGSFFS
jgi:hypothetical protein